MLTEDLGIKVALLDLCRIFSSILRVLRANTHWYLTEKRVKWAEKGNTKMMTGLLSEAPQHDIKASKTLRSF